jgi:hypothetical protein
MYCTQPYKEYVGSYDWSEDEEDECVHGKILYITDLISYESDGYDGIQAAFESAVDHYLETCDAIGELPNDPIPTGYLKIDDAPRDGTRIYVIRPDDLKPFEAWFHADGISLLATGPEKTGTWDVEAGGWFEKGEVHYWLPNDQPTEGYVVKWGDAVKHTQLVDSDDAAMEFYYKPNYKAIGVTAVFPNN